MNKKSICKKIIAGTGACRNPKNILIYVMYTDMTYEELWLDIGDPEISYKVKTDYKTYWKPKDGQYYDVKYLTWNGFVHLRKITFGKFTKQEVHDYIDSKTREWKKLIEFTKSNQDKIWNNFDEFMREAEET